MADSTAAPPGPKSVGSAAPGQLTPLWTLKATQLLGTAAWACLGKFIVVFYADIGMTRYQIGIFQCAQPWISFVGQFFWASIIDWLANYKWPLVGTSVVGSLVVFLQLLPSVQQNIWLLFAVNLLWSWLLCTGGPIIDAMCLTVLDEQNVTDEGYGDQRLWCAVGWGGMSLLAGKMIDVFGISFIFYGHAFFQGVNIMICVIFLPPPKKKPRTEASETGVRITQLCNFDVFWLFANLFLYGAALCLIENFLLVFLMQNFVNTPKVLLGMSVAVMCAFEVPVFMYIGRLWTQYGISLTTVILACQLILVLRCLLYMLVEDSQVPWLVLLVEPLHGLTFAAMWTATVEYGKKLSPANAVARMQTLVNGVFIQVGMGFGSIFWGGLVEQPPDGLGFRRCFQIDAVLVLLWCAIWLVGLQLRARCSTRRDSSDVSWHPLDESAHIAD